MIPLILVLTFSILLTLVFAIPCIIMCIRWMAMLETENSESEIGIGDMKVPTFYAFYVSESGRTSGEVAILFCMSVVGGVFGGIHCAGWYFDFPSSAEAMLWRVSSAVLTGIAFLFPIFIGFMAFLSELIFSDITRQDQFSIAVSTIIVLVYVVSRLLLLVEAFISLRHFTPGMLELVKWTSFIPHI